MTFNENTILYYTRNFSQKIFSYFLRSYFDLFIIGGLIFLALFVFLQNFTYPFFVGDEGRDYLVAHYIATHREFLFVGAYNWALDWFNSPLYLYFLAFFLAIHDSVFFLGLVHIFLQILAVIFVYLIARNIFGKGAALVASLIFILVLYGLTLQYLNYMTAFWLMQPLVLFLVIYFSC